MKLRTDILFFLGLAALFLQCARHNSSVGIYWLHQENSPVGNFPDGPWVDARPYVNLRLAIDAIGTNEVNLLISKQLEIGKDSLDVPANITLQFLRGGSLFIKDDTVNISGFVDAGPWQIFDVDGRGKGKITFKHSLTTEVYPQWWGAVAGSGQDCAPAIQRAIDVEASYGMTVIFPSGRYLIRSPVQMGVDHLKIYGLPGSVIVVEDTIIALAAHKRPLNNPKDNPPDRTLNLSLEGIAVQYLKAAPNSKDISGIQLNNCVDFRVENVRVIGDGLGMDGSKINGITCAYVYSTGIFKNVIIDGVSKPGFYAAAGHDILFDGCVARRCSSAYDGIKNPGFGISNVKNVTLMNCEAYDNEGPGVQLSPTLNTYDPTWNQPSPATPCLPEKGDSNSYCSVQIIGGHFHHNRSGGIVTGTKYVMANGKIKLGGRGYDTQIIGANCSDNKARGIDISAVENMLIADCIAARNQTGIAISDGLIPLNSKDSLPDITNNITVRGCQIYDNDRIGILIRQSDQITIENCRIYNTSDTIKHIDGVIYATSFSSKRSGKREKRHIQNLRITDVDFYPMHKPVLPVVYEDTSVVNTGHYRLQWRAGKGWSPDGKLHAPPASLFTNLDDGITYRKAGWDTSKDTVDKVWVKQ